MPKTKQKTVRLPRKAKTHKKPAATATTTHSKGANDGKEFTVHNHQYVLDVKLSPTEFTSAVFTMQPGNSTLFPWLSGVALNYTMYKFTKLVAKYTPTCGTTTGGRVGIYWEYDIMDPVATSYSQASVMPNFTSTNSYEPVSCSVNIPKLNSPISKRYVSTSSQLDRFCDAAKLIVIVQSPVDSTAQTIGQLTLEYSCMLFTPVSGATTTKIGRVMFESTTPDSSATSVSFAPAVTSTINTGGPNLKTTSNGLVKVPPGTYKVSAQRTLEAPYYVAANTQSADTRHGFLYNAIDSLTGGTFDQCGKRSHNAPAAVGTSTKNSWFDTFMCVVDIPVEQYVGPLTKYDSYSNIGTTTQSAGGWFELERLGESLAKAGGFTEVKTLRSEPNSDSAPPPSDECPNWPIITAPTKTLTSKARLKLASAGLREPFHQAVLDALPDSDWERVESKAS